MAIAGEPLSGQHGVLMYSVQGAKGTAVTPATAFGICEAPTATSDAGLRMLFGIGSPHYLVAKPGIVAVPISIPNIVLQSAAVLNSLVERVSGALPWVTIGIGYKDDAGTRFGWQIQDCKVGAFDLSWDAGGADGSPLTCGLTFETLGRITELTSLDPTNLATLPWDNYEAVMTKGGAAYEALSFKLTVAQNLRKIVVLRGATVASGKREAKYLQEANEVITGNITAAAKTGINLQADTLSSFALRLLATDIAAGVNTCQIDLAGVYFKNEQMTLGNLVFSTDYEAQTFTIT